MVWSVAVFLQRKLVKYERFRLIRVTVMLVATVELLLSPHPSDQIRCHSGYHFQETGVFFFAAVTGGLLGRFLAHLAAERSFLVNLVDVKLEVLLGITSAEFRFLGSQFRRRREEQRLDWRGHWCEHLGRGTQLLLLWATEVSTDRALVD